MKIIFTLMLLLCSFQVFAQNVVNAPIPAPTVATPTASPVPSAPVMLASADKIVPVAEPAAPPKWAEDVIVTAQKLPIVGPIVSKALLYLGIVSSIITGFIAFLLTALSALSGVFNLAGLTGLSDKIQLFKDGKIMYWLKYFSMFNAKKSQPEGDTIKS
jgi:hypothetical protein